MTQISVEERARQSQGISNNVVYAMVAHALAESFPVGVLADVGCGEGQLYSFIGSQCESYLGIDVVRYQGLPNNIEFVPLDLDTGNVSLPDNVADVVCAVEVIEHLENPRAFVRELVRLAKPGGFVIVTTPNQLSLLSKLTLILKNQFNYFQEAPGLYPAHITAVLEIDLIRIFTESGLTNIEINYSNVGRIPFTPWHWPRGLGLRDRNFSDNILCMGLKPNMKIF